MKLANALTLSRALFAPIFFLIYFVPIWTDTFVFASGVIMIPLLACMEITDFFDGFFARKSKMVTDLGKMFDPFADVIVHLTTFTCFLYSYNEQFAPYTPVLIFIFILYREFTQTFFRMLAAKQGVAIGARKGGKLKTVFYVATSFFCLAQECAVRTNFSLVLNNAKSFKTATLVLFVVCVVLSYVSFFDYAMNFKNVIKSEDA
ncbi:MAG: CDP-diacylglycerol--glycerol-3-phosphate 3-phosphatidyltransferase [Treponema sp.]|nr:CDP-diacylglycerol--glycerol-3-phosphate 3-phosphatidyltransferase [Treponema sp.]